MEPLDVHFTNITQKEKEAKVAAIIEKVGLNSDSLNKYPHEFSGGQRQRIGIARALIVNPEFLVCDESVSALDVSVQAQVLNLLNQLKADFGFTMLFISHDLSVVRYMADRILVMQKGQIIEENEADYLFSSPEKEYTKTLINAIPALNS
jgi:peptide/nickel transport system ATP-binding protein